MEIECVDDLARLADDNAAAWWTELAAARGHAMIGKAGYFWVPGSLRSGLRIMVLRPDIDPVEQAEIAELVRTWPKHGRLTVEDPYNVLDLAEAGLTPANLPIMAREPGPVAGTPRVEATTVTDPDEISVVEKTVVDSFPLRQFLPYRAGEAIPSLLAERPGIGFHLARRAGEPAGACITVNDGHACGVYWVATLPDHRSQGVGRAVMTAALNHVDDVPATLTATEAGRPLYESMGFRTVARATWWWTATR